MTIVSNYDRVVQKEAYLDGIVSLLEVKFGSTGELPIERLKRLRLEEMKKLMVALLEFQSPSDLIKWLEQHYR